MLKRSRIARHFKKLHLSLTPSLAAGSLAGVWQLVFASCSTSEGMLREGA